MRAHLFLWEGDEGTAVADFESEIISIASSVDDLLTNVFPTFNTATEITKGCAKKQYLPPTN